MVCYVKTVYVQYGDSSNALEGIDINSGMGGEYVYLVPQYTHNRDEAAHAFTILTTYNEDLVAADLGKGDGKPLYRYINTLWTGDKSQAITKVWLSTIQDTTEGDGRTGDINADRGGPFLYLCWEYGYAPDDISVSGHYIEKRDTEDEDEDEDEDLCQREVPIESIVFSQDSISNRFRDGSDIRELINRLREMSLEERRALINLFPVMNVVPIPMAGRQYLLSCDNRRLHVYRSVLPEGTMVTVQNAPKRERKKLQWKWTSKNGGLYISVRGHRKGGQGNQEL